MNGLPAALIVPVIFMLIFSSGVMAQRDAPCECKGPRNPNYTPGVVWKGERPDMGLEDIALLLAPVLWFSSDEPLITEREGPVPHAHPCDPAGESENGVVYYQVRSLKLKGRAGVLLPLEKEPEFFDKVERMILRYYFYYREDIGLSPHTHDLEVADFHVLLEQADDGCYQVRVERVIGLAHGVDWYSNELEIERDTRFPVTLFVEEGKHASCPDRNADGTYTPGYDVNHRINDAWGVRDVLRTGYIVGAGFQASMFKPRWPDYRVLPPESPYDFSRTGNASLEADPEFLGRYELRRGSDIAACENMSPEAERLLGMMKKHKFGRDYPPEQHKLEIQKELAQPLTGTNSLMPAVSLRFDRNRLGGSFLLRGLDLGEGYLVPKINLNGEAVSFEGLFTRSAAQFFSWYLTGGAAYEAKRVEDESGSTVVLDEYHWRFVSELGIKFRVRLSGKKRLFSLGYHFAGMRVGLRNSGWPEFDDLRLVIEIGAGVW